jgi:hypothetical protein
MLTNRVPDPEFSSDDLYKAPENRLLLAVLYDALATFQRGLDTSVRKDITTFREVDSWFRNRSYDSPFSFESICYTFQIDPEFVRDELNRLRRSMFMSQMAMEHEGMPRATVANRRAWITRLG